MATKNYDELKQLGNVLRTMRETAKITQEKLGELLGDVDAKLVSRYENGDAEMGALRYDKWLSIFGQKVDDELTKQLLQIFASLPSEEKKRIIIIASALRDAFGRVS